MQLKLKRKHLFTRGEFYQIQSEASTSRVSDLVLLFLFISLYGVTKFEFNSINIQCKTNDTERVAIKETSNIKMATDSGEV